MKPLLILLLLFTSCNPYRELKWYKKKLEKWDEYFKKRTVKKIKKQMTKIIGSGYSQKEVETLLATQHKNTRHDAIEQLNSIYNDFIEKDGFDVGDTINKIEKAIMNLKQRSPFKP